MDSRPGIKPIGERDRIPTALPWDEGREAPNVGRIHAEAAEPFGDGPAADGPAGRRNRLLLWTIPLAIVAGVGCGVFLWLRASRTADEPAVSPTPAEDAWQAAERLSRQGQVRRAIAAYQQAGKEAEHRDRAVERLLSLMQSDDPANQQRCRMALDEVDADWRESGPAKAAVRRLGRVATGPACAEQRAAVQFLQTVRSRQAIPCLIRALPVQDYALYSSTALALDEADPQWRRSEAAQAAAGDLAEGLKHEDNRMRLAVAALLGEIGARAGIGPLAMARMTDRSEEVRTAAGRSLGQIDPNWGRSSELAGLSKLLVRELARSDRDAASRAAELLGEIGAADLAGPLADAALRSTTEADWSSQGDWAPLRGAALAALLRLQKDWRQTDAAEKVLAACTAALGVGMDYHDYTEREIEAQARLDAAKLLGLTGLRGAIPPLIDCLLSQDEALRQVARESLAGIDKDWAQSKEFEASIPRIAASYERGDDQITALMRETGKDRFVEPLIRLLYTVSENHYLDAISALKSIEPQWAKTETARRHVPQFIAGLDSRDGQIRENCALHLGELGDPQAIEPLIMALGDEDTNLTYRAKNSLASLDRRWRRSEAVQACVARFIQRLKGDEDYHRRAGAAEGLAELAGPEAVEPLLDALRQDTSGAVRVHVLTALYKFESPKIVEVLRTLVHDEDDDVRENVWRLLAAKSEPDRFPYLLKLLASPRDFTRTTAVLPLESADRQWKTRKEVLDAVPSVIAQLADDDSRARVGAAHALGVIGDMRALDPLIKALNDADPWVCVQAVWALGELGDAKALPALRSLQETSKDADVKRAIYYAIEKLSKSSTQP